MLVQENYQKFCLFIIRYIDGEIISIYRSVPGPIFIHTTKLLVSDIYRLRSNMSLKQDDAIYR